MNKPKHLINIIYLLLAGMLTMLASCVDEFGLDYNEIPEGESLVDFEVEFKPLTKALTRSNGNALNKIDYLWLVAYTADGKLSYTKKFSESDLVYEPGNANSKVSFSLQLPNGRYRMYAVANTDLTDLDLSSEEKLRSIPVEWNDREKTADDKFDVTPNRQMFGYFENKSDTDDSEYSPGNYPFSPDKPNESDDNRFKASLIEIGKTGSNSLHASLWRAASKITMAYDGSGLKEGVYIYIKSVQVKDIPRWCRIGDVNTVTDVNDLIHDGEKIVYHEKGSGTYTPESFPAYISKTHNYPDVTVPAGKEWGKYVHSSDCEFAQTNALFFYENMQGRGKDKTSKDDTEAGKDSKPLGTYIEVDAIYKDGADLGYVKYRFMLGLDKYTDYNAARNCHYKVTLKFKGSPKDPDWHIEYTRQIFEVSPERQRFNYQGYYFNPDYSVPNLGYDFIKTGVPVTVSSYTENEATGEITPVKWTATFDYADEDGNMTNHPLAPSWITGFVPVGETTGGDGGKEDIIQVQATPQYETVEINDKLKNAPAKTGVYNLASSDGYGDNIQNTANCYIVDSKGTYKFPLVYGNAITGGIEVPATYSSNGTAPDNLKQFTNHLGHPITSAYIKKTIENDSEIPAGEKNNHYPYSAEIIWQDVDNLVQNLTYDPNLYSNKGGIRFTIGDNITQGNAVIAIKNNITDIIRNEEGKAIKVEKGYIMWSWHIWVTNMNAFEEKNITVTAADKRQYSLMPVNLGWCSNGEDIKYYRKRTCKIKFTAQTEDGPITRTVEIIKEPHIGFPRGNNPYYQWGRKDPFVGSNALWQNKKRWVNVYKVEENGWVWSYPAAVDANPTRFYEDTENSNIADGEWGATFLKGQARITSRQFISEDEDIKGFLVRYPDVWHNPPRRAINKNSYVSENITYSNLWGGLSEVKTVYDPCPVGYQVPENDVFSGLTVRGENTSVRNRFFDVQISDIASGNHTDNLYEFYTSPDKYQSIIFPETGYRDWDAAAGIYKFGGNPGASGYNAGIGYVWTRQIQSSSFGLTYPDAAYNLEFSRHDPLYGSNGYIRPMNAFYTCDGFPVRPVKR